MFRNVVGESRDLYVLQWDPGKQPTEPRKVGTGSWALNACPMDGGIAQRGNDIATAWRRDKTVYLTEGGNEETGIAEGKNVTIALGPSGVYAAWTGANGIEVHEPGQKGPGSFSPSGAFPAMNSLSNGSVVVAWEDNGRIETEIVH